MYEIRPKTQPVTRVEIEINEKKKYTKRLKKSFEEKIPVYKFEATSSEIFIDCCFQIARAIFFIFVSTSFSYDFNNLIK